MEMGSRTLQERVVLFGISCNTILGLAVGLTVQISALLLSKTCADLLYPSSESNLDVLGHGLVPFAQRTSHL